MRLYRLIGHQGALGFIIAVAATLAYLHWGTWDNLGWEPEPQWAKIVFYPGVAAGIFCGERWNIPIQACQSIGVLVMGAAGFVLGRMLQAVFHKR